MLSPKLLWAVGLFGFVLGVAFSLSMGRNPEAPGVEANQQPQCATADDKSGGNCHRSAKEPITFHEKINAAKSPEVRQQKKQEAEEEAGEYWPWRPWGIHLKITDSLLALFTGLLVGIGWWQGYQLRRTVESVENSERPFVVENYDQTGVMPGGYTMHMYPEVPVTYFPKVGYRLINCGKTPAIIFSQYVDLIVVERLPENPFPTEATYGDQILPGGDPTQLVEIPMGDGTTPQPFSVEDWAAMRAGTKFFLFLGRANYKSMFGREHETRFCYRWYIRDNRSFFAAVGGEAYNKRT